MNVALVSTYTYPLALGMRYVSAFLKRNGHQVTCLFMSSVQDKGGTIPPTIIDEFVEHCRGVDLVGLSLMTNSFFRSCELTRALRAAAVKAPIVWGGTHPTVAPEESANEADYICIGEGEQSLLAFLDAMEAGRDLEHTPGFACFRNGEFVQNPTYPLTDDLDTYPFPDYDSKDHYIADGGHLVQARPELLRGTLRRYRLSATRGCPFSCSFCNNATQLQLYRKAGYASQWVRKRSTESILSEIEHIRSRYPQVEAINIIDDLFLIRSETELEEFVEAYARRVDLPLEIDVFPNTVSDAKIRLLSRLPIELISMGIQSGSQDTLYNIYNRPTRVETVARAIRTISRHGFQAEYHYIVGNPFESEDSMIETLRFAASHHRGPAKLRIFPLQFYPGSVLYQRARREGVIGEKHDEAYRLVYTGKQHLKRAAYLEIWLRMVLALRGTGVPSRLVHAIVSFAIHPWTRKCLDHRWFGPLAFVAYRIGRVLHKNLVYKPFVKPVRSLRSRRRRRRRPAPRRHGLAPEGIHGRG